MVQNRFRDPRNRVIRLYFKIKTNMCFTALKDEQMIEDDHIPDEDEIQQNENAILGKILLVRAILGL